MTDRFYLSGSTGNIGIGETNPQAALHIKAGTASTAPLIINSGSNLLLSPVDGAIENDGSNLSYTSGTTRYTLAKTLTATRSLDFTSTGGYSSSDKTINVTGAADGDVVSIGIPSAAVLGSSAYTAFVSAAGVVTIRFINYSGSSQDPPSANFRVTIIKY